MGTEIAKAYVQIMPSAKGIQANLGKMLGKEMPTAGASAGHQLGGSIVKSLKGFLATAGIGAAVGKVLTEGAAVEQSIGGIETLFKDSADLVVQRANEAYKTAGMSANQYMELTTSFSASLLQSLEGDTRAAADSAHMAMVDMSDNANKMGTDLGRITDAYQGFAKGNYTMLDNLKLGYGGTQKEMERLLADAQKISGVKYDIGNLDDVYQAIHVIQGEIGITGTTAKEASETFSGSLSAMKSAASNVMADLMLGKDLGPSLNALAETATIFLIGNLLPAVWNIMKALPGAIITFLQAAVPQMAAAFVEFIPQVQEYLVQEGPKLMQSAQQMVANFCNGFPAAFPQVIEQGSNMLMQLIGGISEMLPKIGEMSLHIITTVVNNLVANLPQIMENGSKILLSLVDGIKNNLPALVSAAADAIITMVTGLINNLPQIISAGYEMIASLVSGIGDALPNLGRAAGEIVRKIWDTIKSIDWLQLGIDIIRGIINGIGSMAGALWQAARDVASAALGSIKGFFGIASPSKVMRDEVGRFIPAGLAVGIEDNMGIVEDAMASLSDTAMEPVKNEISVDAPYNTAPAATPIYLNVYGSPNQDVHELARIVMQMLQQATESKGAIFA